MVGKNQKRFLIPCVAALLLSALPLSAQRNAGQTDSLVRLLNARFIEQAEQEDSRMIRKAIEPTFLHNGTYLSCDTAFWHVDEKIINCFGHVQLMQGESVLTSEKLDYLVDENLAQFRGAVVQLRNKKENLLRTRILDYNTQDSLAVFRGGASMKSEDGQIIESDEGTYSNSTGLFSFQGNVNMFTDSVFVKTNALNYDSDRARADFVAPIDFWKDGNMLSAGAGWYERDEELFFFRDAVHGLGETQESWSDSLYYYRSTDDILMLGNIQIQDQSRQVAAMGDRLHYVDSLSCVTLEKRASAALWDGEGEQRDTTYLGAERFVYDTRKMCDIDKAEVRTAENRLEEMLGDPVAEYRRRAAEQAAQAAAEALRDDPNAGPRPGSPAARNTGRPARSGSQPQPEPKPESKPEPKPAPEAEPAPAPADTLRASADTLRHALPDSLAAGVDSLAVPPPDTTKVGFLLALGDVRVFRKDMQVRCDSLRYTDLDSIARLYKDPIVWNEGNRQYNSDSLFVLIREGRMERANLLSNAFIHTEEAEGLYDQIRSTDVIAYFNDSTALRRFDALGGVSALFYLEETATVNKVECKMMMATLEHGEVQRVYNFDNPKNDAYPTAQLPEADRILKGFNWQPDRRPKDKYDVTSMVVKDSERAAYEARPRTSFLQTDIYFPGHMKELYAGLEAARARRRARQAAQADAGAPAPDSLALQDSLRRAGRDSLAVGGPGVAADSLAVRDSLSVGGIAGPEPESQRDTTYMSERELKRALRIARRDARWAELDARDAAKAAKKEARKAERQARKEARRAKHAAKQAAIDAAKLQKYIERYQKQKERNEGRKQKSLPAGERPPAPEAGGEVPAPAGSE
ncbi:MAG: hypothetical protein IKO29_00355 [Bacteroidales bacterium]|nr:hypothetical protein [Bacteroidales bacterium]